MTLAAAGDERAADVSFNDDALAVRLMDGRTISAPLVWYPRLLAATPAQRANWRITGGGYGIHWPDVDEDLSTEGLLRAAPAPRRAEGDPSQIGSPSRKAMAAPLTFERFNETDVREEVIAPLLLRLGL